ncbi:hypothetical protein OT109_12115 [Phycisphaeraceae bacterium D3-23]
MMTSQHNLNHVEPAKGVTLCAAETGHVALHPFFGQADQAGAYLSGISSMPIDTEPGIGRVRGWLGHEFVVSHPKALLA